MAALRSKTRPTKPHLLLYLLVFALVGGSILLLSLAAPNPNLPGDLNNDNKVDGADLAFLASVWKTNTPNADLNNDSIVNGADLSILLSNYGKSTGTTTPVNFGETNVLSTDDFGNANLMVAQSASLSQSGTLQSLSFYVSQASGKLRLGLYDASGPSGGPGNKLDETAEITPIAGWNTANVLTPASLSAGNYWLAYLASDNNLHFVKTADGSSSGRIYPYAYSAMPATFSTAPNSSPSHWSFYATLGTSSTTPSVNLSASPSSISSGGSSSLSWNSSNTTSCTATWTTSHATSGSQSVSPTSTTSYSISCTGTGGTVNASTTVTVGGGTTSYTTFVGSQGPDLQLAASKGIHNVRTDIYNLTKAKVDAARAAGIQTIIPIADYNPYTDLRPAGTSDHYAPATTAQRITWSQRMMQTIVGDFSTPPQAIEIWNEPWGPGFWSQGPNAADYLDMVHQFSLVAWATPGYANMKLLVSCDPGWGGWCDQLIAADTNNYLNDPRMAPTVHPYCNDRSPDFHSSTTQAQKDYDCDRYKFTYNIWKAHGAADPKVWLTEFGWVSLTPGSKAIGSEGPGVSEQTQSDYTVKMYKNALASGQVAEANAYMLSACSEIWSYNWIRPDCTDKPVIAAVKSLIINGN